MGKGGEGRGRKGRRREGREKRGGAGGGGKGIATLIVDGWAITFCTLRRGLG